MPVLADPESVNFALLGLRLLLALVMLAHGINHIFGGGKIDGTGDWFASMGMRPGWLHAWAASGTEVGAGVMLAAGLLTPLAAGGVVGVMAVAFVVNHRKNGFFIFRPGEGYEYVLTLTVMALVAATLGPGEWSIDDAVDLGDLAGWSGLLIASASGFGGAALLLAGFWRPTREADD